MNEYITRTCVYYPPWESNLLRFQYYFVGVQFHWLMLMQAISLYRSRPDPRESVRNSSSVYQDTRYQDFPLIAMSGYPLKNRCCEILFQIAFYLNIYFILGFIRFLKLGMQFVMYYKLRCNSTQFVIYYKLPNYYKLQCNTAKICQT